MSTEHPAGPGAGGDLVARLTTHLDRHATRLAEPEAPPGPDEPAPVPDGFEGLTDELRSMATWAEPPAGLRDRILAQVRAPTAEPAAEPAAADSAAEPAAEPAPAPDRTDRSRRWLPAGWRARSRPADWRARWWPADWRSRWGRLAWAIPAAALAAAVFTGGVLAVDRALQPDRRGEVYQATGTELAPQATAEVSVVETGSGFSMWVRADGLPAAATGSYYAAWLRGEQGMVPLGTFHERRTGTPIELWSGVDPADYDALVVTLQAEGEPPTPSPLVVMTAPLDR